MIPDYMTLGGVEIFNTTRLQEYLTSVGSALDSVGTCSCATLTRQMIDEDPDATDYVDPATDLAPWYDPDVPESVEFAGFLPLTVDGLDVSPVRRSVTNAVAGGAAIGPARALPLTITVTGLLLGSTCCGVAYGLHWLGEALQGCTGGQCDGDCMTLYNCCPGSTDLTPEAFNDKYRRTVRRVALIEGPTPIDRVGENCTSGECQSGAEILTVEFILTAATPWLWTDTTPILETVPPADDSGDCVTWCIKGDQNNGLLCFDLTDEACPAGTFGVEATEDPCALAWPVDEDDPCDLPCRFATCPDPTALCASPSCQPPSPPTVLVPDTCFCLPLVAERACYEIDLTERPTWSVDTPMITLRAGDTDLRNITLTFYEREPNHETLTCDQIADLERCNPHSSFTITFVPAGGVVTLDGQIGRALVECGGVCESSPDVYGLNGAPVSWKPFTCATYCLCIESDIANPPSVDSLITVAVSGRGY
ncbi:hypothetical protein [Streptomyces sp. NPDC047070]|uniref:hypothetical protein n=1 Tax=Streptomyces sp. NPDC047070 TaxID=3154923 RepID=UPI0034540641